MRRCMREIVTGTYGMAPTHWCWEAGRPFRGLRAKGIRWADPLLAQKFKEPVALSSTEPADFPLPRTALELGFDLVALRAPCRAETSRGGSGRQDRPRDDCCKLRQVFLRLPQPSWTVGCRRGPCSSVDRRGHGHRGRCRADAARGGGRPECPAELAGARARARAGRDGAPARLIVGAPDPRPVARRLGVPEGARGV